MIKITATVKEIQAIRPDLTEEQIKAVLNSLGTSQSIKETVIHFLLNIYYPLTKSKPF